MALITNKLDVFLDTEEFDRRYDVFEVTKQGEGKLSWSSRAFEPFGRPYILSILGQGPDKPFYILSPRDSISTKGLKSHFENTCVGMINHEDMESPGVAKDLLPKKVPSGVIPTHVLIQLLFNSLHIEQAGGEASLQNVTGHLYYFKPRKGWIKTGKGNPNYQIIGLEFRVTEDMLLKVDVRTFTRANDSRLVFKKRKKNEYPRYVVDLHGPTMRRVAPGEKPSENNVYIQKQHEGKKNRIPYLKYKGMDHFMDSKCGIIWELTELFNKTYAGLASLQFQKVDEARRRPVPQKLVKLDYKALFLQSEYVVVDVAQDDASSETCEAIAGYLANENYLGKRPRITNSAVVGANNLLIIHNEEYYRDRNIADPYKPSENNGAACQHLTIETVQDEYFATETPKNLRYIIDRCLLDAGIKQDIARGRMCLYDWQLLKLDRPLIFSMPEPKTDEERRQQESDDCPKRYSFLEVSPDGGLVFNWGCIGGGSCDSRWDWLASDLAAEWSFRTEGFVIDGDDHVSIIEKTDGFPLPYLEGVRGAIEEIDWTLPTGDILDFLSSIHSGDHFLDDALDYLSDRVSRLGQPTVGTKELNALISEAAKQAQDQYSPGRIRRFLRKPFEEMFDKKLQTSISRDKRSTKENFEALVGIHCLEEGSNLLYWCNSFEGLSQVGRDNGCVIRRVRGIDGIDAISDNLVETLAIPIARLNIPSVLPLPFKYLREWMKLNGVG